MKTAIATEPRRYRPLLSYVLPTTIVYHRVGNVGVYVMTDADRRRALALRAKDTG